MVLGFTTIIAIIKMVVIKAGIVFAKFKSQSPAKFPVGQVYVGIEYTTSAGRNYTIHAGPMNVLRDYRLAVG